MKPVAYINVEKRTLEFAEPIKWHTPTVANLDRIPLFTKEALAQPEQEPVAWQVMVEDEAMKEFSIKDIAHDWCVQQKLSGSSYTYWLRPLYTTPPQRTEPVAWLEPEWGEKICPEVGFEATTTSDHPRDLCWIPLYPHPPQRTWVGLEGEEIRNLWEEATKPDRSTMTMVTSFAKSIEAKLKQLNT